MNPRAVDRALETSTTLCRTVHVVIRQASERAALNRARLRDSAERRSVRNRAWIIREKLWDGRLPGDRPAIVSGQPGCGERCAVCETVTSPSQLVMAIPIGDRGSVVYLHAECFQAWETLRRVTVTPPPRQVPRGGRPQTRGKRGHPGPPGQRGARGGPGRRAARRPLNETPSRPGASLRVRGAPPTPRP